MGAKSTIEWTDATWSPLRVRVRAGAAQIARLKGYTSLIQIGEKMAGRVGQHCEHVSDGCRLCYSGTWQVRCLTGGGTGLPFDRRSRDLIEPFVDEKTLVQPLKWRTPKKIFVENQSDLFGEWYSDEQIDRVFAVMALCPQHTFQVLTKRPERMLAYLAAGESPLFYRWSYHASRALHVHTGVNDLERDIAARPKAWPLPNVWLGVSIEDQATADARIPLLLQTPASKRFVSYEPALGSVDFNATPHGIDWIIVGGESGPGARPFDIAWARNTIEQCRAAGVACFVKQLGAKPFWPLVGGFGQWAEHVRFTRKTSRETPYHWDDIRLKDRKGGDMSEWPEDLRVREFPTERRAA